MRTAAVVSSCSGKGNYFFITLAEVDSERDMTLFQDSFPKKKTGPSVLSIETRPRPQLNIYKRGLLNFSKISVHDFITVGLGQ